MESSKVFVFPCVSRTDDDTTNGNISRELRAKLMSEENITNILKSITDKKSYIIEYDSNTKLLKFVLDGYYFEISDYSPSGNQYARIDYKSVSSTNEFQLIKGDVSNNFDGLIISQEQPVSDYLTLCMGGEIPQSSYSKFKLSSVDGKLNAIDCGELK